MATPKASYKSASTLKMMIAAARGQVPVDLVFSGGHYLDVFSGSWRQGEVAVHAGMIVGVGESYDALERIDVEGQYLVPGFIDAHVHIESSLMTPARFQQSVLPVGTTTVIWDPHEIANVWGAAGIEWAIAAAAGLVLDIFVMVPSCVPSTSPQRQLETSGAQLSAADLTAFREHPRVLGLAEMMNYPGLLGGEPEVLDKLIAFAELRRDGHCPKLSGKDLNAYGVAGIHSCHESTSLVEADEKLGKGIHVLIREGSCAKDADTLLPLLNAYTSACIGLCSDDRNPLDIAESGHISAIIDKALRRGIAPAAVLRAASYAAARLYGLDDRGAVAPGYVADLVRIAPRDNDTWRSGLKILGVYKQGQPLDRCSLTAPPPPRPRGIPPRNLRLEDPLISDFRVPASAAIGSRQNVRVIGVIPAQIVTEALSAELLVVAGQEGSGGEVAADVQRDILKIAVLERHHGSNRRSVGFVRGFNLHSGAIATSINHDSHNIICVGSSDELMTRAVAELKALDGGIVVVGSSGELATLRLEIGGLMTDAAPEEVASALRTLKALAQSLGCSLEEPFLQLSFLALPVIPALKITDRGLVDVASFKLVSVAL